MNYACSKHILWSSYNTLHFTQVRKRTAVYGWVFLPSMYLSKCSMSPVHNSRPLNTRLLRLARLLLASSTSVLVSIHIPAAAGPHRYKCDVAEMLGNHRAPLYFVAYICSFRSSVCSPVASASPSFSIIPSPLFLLSLLPLRWGLRGWLISWWCNVFTRLSTGPVRQEQSPTPSGLGRESQGSLVHPWLLLYFHISQSPRPAVLSYPRSLPAPLWQLFDYCLSI